MRGQDSFDNHNINNNIDNNNNSDNSVIHNLNSVPVYNQERLLVGNPSIKQMRNDFYQLKDSSEMKGEGLHVNKWLFTAHES